MIHNFNARVIVFSGPRERGLAKKIVKELPKGRAMAFDTLKTADFVSALARLSVLIANHSGPAHVAAAVGTPVVAACASERVSPYDLLGRQHKHLRSIHLTDIHEDEMYAAACALLQTSRSDILRAI